MGWGRSGRWRGRRPHLGGVERSVGKVREGKMQRRAGGREEEGRGVSEEQGYRRPLGQGGDQTGRRLTVEGESDSLNLSGELGSVELGDWI